MFAMRQLLLIVLMLSALLLTAPMSVRATEEYAIQSGEDCGACHVNPAGGGELTAIGEGYGLALLEKPLSPERETAQKKTSTSYVVRMIAGYFHILFAFFWFGTILYVHLVLKPAYASGGLPRGEVRLGLLSMLIMAVTGAILFAYRVPSVEFLLSTRFGLLLLVKIALFLIMVSSALFVVLYIGPRLRRKSPVETDRSTGDMTPERLATFDGKEGRPAYFAYQGDIFDVTASDLWTEGNHLRRHEAGTDLSDVLGQAPHGEDKVLAMPKVGKLLSEEAQGKTPQQKVFYFMAYMNLSFVLLIILILAFWNWL